MAQAIEARTFNVDLQIMWYAMLLENRIKSPHFHFNRFDVKWAPIVKAVPLWFGGTAPKLGLAGSGADGATEDREATGLYLIVESPFTRGCQIGIGFDGDNSITKMQIVGSVVAVAETNVVDQIIEVHRKVPAKLVNNELRIFAGL